MTLSEVVAVNIHTLRVKRKLSQQALANRTGLSVSYISMLERGNRTPPLDTLESLARSLKVKPIDLLSA
jgi:transcriptional regulator with XRE-family HTH domain